MHPTQFSLFMSLKVYSCTNTGKCSFWQLPLYGVEAAFAAWESVLPNPTRRTGLCDNCAILQYQILLIQCVHPGEV